MATADTATADMATLDLAKHRCIEASLEFRIVCFDRREQDTDSRRTAGRVQSVKSRPLAPGGDVPRRPPAARNVHFPVAA
jgi:hypothetical protein